MSTISREGQQWHAVPALDAPIHRRCDARLMGMGYLVDSAVAALWDLEARHMPCALDIYADALEYRFPAWMYSIASLRFSLAADFPPLRAISFAMLWISVAAWIATSLGLIISSWRSFHEFSLSERRGSSPQIRNKETPIDPRF